MYEPVEHLPRIGHADARYHRIVDFLYDEAALLDARRHAEWLALLTEDIRYVVPVRVTTAHTLETSTSAMAHLDEDHYSLTQRVQRFSTEHAWAERRALAGSSRTSAAGRTVIMTSCWP